ncbi:restriction endonuclease subunit S [Lysinibacillus fusiformis]|uniref:restriction endonuclease subunit S n=1 Tax=Lysinibacillus fusiformis TaxID=28031 RepID=UPI003CE87281
MELVKLEKIFKVEYGTDLELNKLKIDATGINFVSRTRKNNGVSAKVRKVEGINPNPSGTISVALGSSSVLFAFLQDEPYYSGRDLAYLKPKFELTKQQLLFYCMCITKNRFRYNYGRQANKTIKTLLIPSISSIPEWVNKHEIKNLDSYKLPFSVEKKMCLVPTNWTKFYPLIGEDGLFLYSRGKRLTKLNQKKGDIPLVTAGTENQGIANYIDITKDMKLYKDCITIDMFGNCFYRGYEFYCDDNIIVLENSDFNKYVLLFISTIINKDSFRYSYGKQYRLKNLRKHKILLPSINKNEGHMLDLELMEQYIKTLPFSKSI